MKAFLEIIFHCMSSVNVSVRVNSLEINKPEKTKTFRDATSGLPAKPVILRNDLKNSKLMTCTSDWSCREGNRPFTLRGHVTSFL